MGILANFIRSSRKFSFAFLLEEIRFKQKKTLPVPSRPPQHSPIFGHLASSQTVAKFKSLTVSFKCVNFFPVGAGARSQEGFFSVFFFGKRLGLSSVLPARPGTIGSKKVKTPFLFGGHVCVEETQKQKISRILFVPHLKEISSWFCLSFMDNLNFRNSKRCIKNVPGG